MAQTAYLIYTLLHIHFVKFMFLEANQSSEKAFSICLAFSDLPCQDGHEFYHFVLFFIV